MTLIDVDSTNLNYSTINELLCSKDGTEVIACPTGKTGSVSIPNCATTIKAHAFAGCTGLKDGLALPKNLRSIEANAFSGCSGLIGTLAIPQGVISIGSSSFNGCTGFTGDLVIPPCVESIGIRAFLSCSSLNGKLSIPQSLKHIGDFAFQYCSGLTGDLDIPVGVETIGADAFDSCLRLKSVSISRTVKAISIWAFWNCRSVSSIKVDPENQYYQSIDDMLLSKDGTKLMAYAIGKLGSVSIPNTVTEIDPHAFNLCSGLTSVTIPSSVSLIQRAVFSSCTGLKSVKYFGIIDPGVSSSIFGGCDMLRRVCVANNYTDSTFCGKPVRRCACLTADFSDLTNVRDIILSFLRALDIFSQMKGER